MLVIAIIKRSMVAYVLNEANEVWVDDFGGNINRARWRHRGIAATQGHDSITDAVTNNSRGGYSTVCNRLQAFENRIDF